MKNSYSKRDATLYVKTHSPFRLLRYSKRKTILELADELGVSYTYLSSLEFGCEPKIPYELLENVSRDKLDWLKGEDLEYAYLNFQKELRRINTERLSKDFSNLIYYRTLSPLRTVAVYWKLPTTSQISRLLCVPSSSIYACVRATCRSLPGPVRGALLEVGIPDVDVRELDLNMNEFYDFKHFGPKRATKSKVN